MNIPIRLKVGERIRQLRREYNLTQDKLSELAHIDYKYLQKMEGKNPPNPKIETLEKLAKAFKIPLSKFFNFEE